MGTSPIFFFYKKVKLTVYGCDSYIMQLKVYSPPPKASPCFWPPPHHVSLSTPAKQACADQTVRGGCSYKMVPEVPLQPSGL